MSLLKIERAILKPSLSFPGRYGGVRIDSGVLTE